MEHAILHEIIDGEQIEFYPETGLEDVMNIETGENLKIILGTLATGADLEVERIARETANQLLGGQISGVGGDLTAHNTSNTAHNDIRLAIAAKAPLDSPALTGTPTAPTAAAGTNNTQIATTAFVLNNATAPINTHNADPTAHAGIISTHNSAADAHSDIRLKISTDISTHNADPTAHADIRAAIEAGGAGGGVPVGTIIPYAANGEYPDGYLLCDGSSVLRSMYTDLYNVIGTTYGSVDEEHFNLPDLRDRFVEGAETAGTSKEAGLPNITGETGISNLNGGYGFYTSGGESYSGAFIKGNNFSHSAAGQTTAGTGLGFDASKSSAIYGNSTTVQPPSLTMRYLIKAFNGQTQESALIDITQYANALNGKQDKLANNVDYVVDSYADDDGNWYRVYKSGWIEQGGVNPSGTGLNPMQTTFLKAFSKCFWGWMTILPSATTFTTGAMTITGTTMTMVCANNAYKNYPWMWYAAGQGADET